MELPTTLLQMMELWHRIKILEGGSETEAKIYALECALQRLSQELSSEILDKIKNENLKN